MYGCIATRRTSGIQHAYVCVYVCMYTYIRSNGIKAYQSGSNRIAVFKSQFPQSEFLSRRNSSQKKKPKVQPSSVPNYSRQISPAKVLVNSPAIFSRQISPAKLPRFFVINIYTLLVYMCNSSILLGVRRVTYLFGEN